MVQWYMPWFKRLMVVVPFLVRNFLHFLSPVLMRKLVFDAQTKPASCRPSSMYQDGKALRAPFDHLTVCWVRVQQTLWQQ